MSRVPRPPEQAPTWGPGTRIGSYELIALLAEGGMAEVWLARIAGQTTPLVAIKRMMGALASDPEHVALFLAEARNSAHLNHPHVVQTYELEEQGDSLYLVMEYLDGEDLSVLRRTAQKFTTPLPVHLAVRLVAWAAEGLHYAHTFVGPDGVAMSLVHRDISPHNLMATFDGGLKVLDFGVAKLASANNASGKLRGKIGYMSPEQARGEALDPRSDVFSLGVVLFELITDSRLFPGMEDAQVLGAIAHGRFPKPHERRADVDLELSKIVGRAMAPAAAARFQSAMEFQAALEKWLTARGLVVDAEEVASYLRGLFARRIHQRKQIIDAVKGGTTLDEMTPIGRAKTPARASSSSRSRSRSLRKKKLIPAVAAAATLLLVIIVAVLIGASRAPARNGAESTQKTVVAIGLDNPKTRTKPDSARIAKLELPRVDGAEPDNSKVDGAKVDRTKTDSAKTDSAKTDSAKTDSAKTDSAKTDSAIAKSDSVKPVVKASGAAVVKTSPPGALVSVDGRVIGESPATVDDLAVGEHQIAATLAGYLPSRKTINIRKPGERLPVDLFLSRQPADTSSEKPKPKPVARATTTQITRPKAPVKTGRLTLKTTPWVTVSFGSKVLGDTPLVEVELPVGVQELTLKNPEVGIDSAIEVDIKEDQTTVKKMAF